MLQKFATELRKTAKQALDRGDTDVGLTLSPELAAKVARRCGGERRLIGYRVVRKRDGVREWWSRFGGWDRNPVYAFVWGLDYEENVRSSAKRHDGRVVRVYLRTRPTSPRGGGK